MLWFNSDGNFISNRMNYGRYLLFLHVSLRASNDFYQKKKKKKEHISLVVSEMKV